MKNITDEQIINVVTTSKTLSECLKKLNLYDNSKIRTKLSQKINDLNIELLPNDSKFKYKKIIKNCPICNNEFETQVNHPREKQTCSYSCSNTFFRSGINNGNHITNLIIKNPEYTSNQLYRSLGIYCHGKECIICKENRIIEIHHYDFNHNNNEPQNLIPLCPTHHQLCHSKYYNDIKEQIDNYVKQT